MAAATQEQQQQVPSDLDILKMNGDWPYRWDLVPVGAMYVDKRYQRPLKPITSGLDPRIINSLSLSERPKGEKAFSVIDGQRRRDLLEREVSPTVAVPATVFFGLTQAEEAELFSLFQRERKGITPYERWIADLVAGNPTVKAINKMVAEEGFEIAQQDTTMRHLKAVRAVERIYEQEPELLRRTLQLIRETWNGVPFASRDQMLKSVAQFIIDTPDLDETRFVEKLRTETPSSLDRKSMGLMESKGLQGKSAKYIAEVIQNVYRSSKRAR